MGLGQGNRFNVCELPYAVTAELSPIPTAFNATKGQSGIRVDGGVDETGSSLNFLSGYAFSSIDITTEYTRP